MADALRVMVVGGGIGGLALASALVQGGHAVTVVEKTPAWRPLGAGIVLAANAVACLGAIGLGEAAAAVGYRTPWMDITDAQGGTLQHADVEATVAAVGPSYALHRADLHAVLLDGAAGAETRLGATVASIEDRGDAVDVRLTDGEERRVDLLVGADGLHSRVRELVFADAGAAVRYAGYTCWRLVTENPGLEGAFEMWGAGRRLGLVPLSRGRLYSFLTENGPAKGQDPETGRGAFVAEKFRGFGGPAQPLLDRMPTLPDSAFLRHDIEDLDRQVWRRGRVALMGDAGHATTPNLGQGACQAIEDALALTICLNGISQRDVPAALAAYEEMRAARVKAIVDMSRRFGVVGQLSNPVLCGLANLAVRLTPASVSRASLLKLVEPGLALARQAAGQPRTQAR